MSEILGPDEVRYLGLQIDGFPAPVELWDVWTFRGWATAVITSHAERDVQLKAKKLEFCKYCPHKKQECHCGKETLPLC